MADSHEEYPQLALTYNTFYNASRNSLQLFRETACVDRKTESGRLSKRSAENIEAFGTLLINMQKCVFR